jgi:hypothetical protein
MRRLQDPRWFLIAMFLGIIASVPLIQMIIEVREGNGVHVFEIFEQPPTAANLRKYERNLETDNWLARISRPWFQFAQFQWLKDGAEKVAIGREGWYFFKPGVKYLFAREELAKAATATNDPIAAIVNFRDQLAALGIRLVLMPVPNKESIYPDRFTSRAESLRGLVAPRTEELLNKLRAAEVEVIDLFKVFRDARQQNNSSSGNALYLAQDTHWSPMGVELAAKAVARHLTEPGWIQPGRVAYDERPAPVRRQGDLLRMLQVPILERRLEPESVPCVQVLRRDNGELYNDAAEAEILVLGDSFLRIYQQDAPTGAGFIAHLAKELKQPLISLVNDGGGSTLVREELRARPAFLKGRKLVLWEFVERDFGLGVQGWKLVDLRTSE